MRERPILFSAPMVRAILAGHKTQTRRVIKIRGVDGGQYAITSPEEEVLRFDDGTFHYLSTAALSGPYICPYGQPGDRLWLRESCRAEELTAAAATAGGFVNSDDEPLEGLDGVRYLADNHFKPIENTLEASGRWMELNAYRGKRGAVVPSIHMPRWASRITLDITDVSVERVQEISEDDARAEGVRGNAATTWGCEGLIEDFADLWDSINAKRGNGCNALLDRDLEGTWQRK